MTHNMRNRTVLGLSLVAATCALAACGGGDDSAAKPDAAEKTPSQAASDGADEAAPEPGSEPDLTGIPDVVAEVNGEEVTKDEFLVLYRVQFQQAVTQAQAGGPPPDEDALKAQTADGLVDTELLVQEADARGFEVTDEDVDAELTKIAAQSQMQDTDELIAALEEQGTTEEEARNQLSSQVLIQELVEDEAGPIKSSDQELRKIYQEVKDQAEAQKGAQPQEIPPFAAVKSQIADQARSEKLAEVAKTLVDDLRKDADITINL